MTICFVNLDNWLEHIAKSVDVCSNDTERRLWEMHEQIPSTEWKLGRTLAIKFRD